MINKKVKITTASDWYTVKSLIRSQMNTIGYNRSLYSIYQNINTMVDTLSKLEINKHAKRNENLIQEQIDKINSSIDILEKYLLMAMLMK